MIGPEASSKKHQLIVVRIAPPAGYRCFKAKKRCNHKATPANRAKMFTEKGQSPGKVLCWEWDWICLLQTDRRWYVTRRQRYGTDLGPQICGTLKTDMPLTNNPPFDPRVWTQAGFRPHQRSGQSGYTVSAVRAKGTSERRLRQKIEGRSASRCWLAWPPLTRCEILLR